MISSSRCSHTLQEVAVHCDHSAALRSRQEAVTAALAKGTRSDLESERANELQAFGNFHLVGREDGDREVGGTTRCELTVIAVAVQAHLRLASHLDRDALASALNLANVARGVCHVV